MRYYLSIFSFVLFGFHSNAQTEYTDSIWHSGMFRSYIVHLPPSYDGSTPFPLEIVLHGGGNGGAQKIIDDHQFDEVADTANYITVFPNGYENSWADGRGTTDADLLGLNDVSFLNDLVDTLMTELNINSDKRYLCGGSNGGFMTQRVACQGSSKFSAFASVISQLSDSLGVQCFPSEEINMLLMCSTDDNWVPYNGGQMGPLSAGGWITSVDSTISFWLNHNGIANTPTIQTLPDLDPGDNGVIDHYTYPLTSNNTEVTLYRANGAGHTVPGQLPNWTQIPLLGYVNRDVDGAAKIWEFFKKHCKSDLVDLTENESLTTLQIYPNPANDQATISFSEKTSAEGQLQLTDMNGSVLFKQVVESGSKSASLGTAKCSPGIYFVHYTSENQHFISRLIIQ